MSDDSSYLSFLNSANKSPTNASNRDAPSTGESKTSKLDPTVSSSAVPEPLKSLQTNQVFYISDTDEPFEPMFLDYVSESLPNAKEFQKCLGFKGDNGSIEDLSIAEFDPRGQYKEVIAKVKEAGNGDVKVFRVGIGKTRCEYYVVALAERGLVGVRAKAVES